MPTERTPEADRLRGNRGWTEDDQNVVCPACGYTHGDAWEWVSDRSTESECEECGTTMIVWSEIDVTYHARVPETVRDRILAQPAPSETEGRE